MRDQQATSGFRVLARLTAVGALCAVVIGGTLPAAGSPAAPVIDDTSAPDPVISPVLVSVSVPGPNGSRTPLVVPDGLLPFTVHVERAVAERVGLEPVLQGLAAFNGVPGSRWSVRFGGVIDASEGAAVGDGRSVVFAADWCPSGAGGLAHRAWPGAPDRRYGAQALYLQEVDIAICPSVRTPAAMRRVVAHEIGHALGMEHLCNPGEPCHLPGMGAGPHECRIMYHGLGGCALRLPEADRDAVRTLYPTLRRLAGPDRYDTAARTSLASVATGRARTVVVARGDGSAHGPLVAAGLAGAVGGPLLLATPAASGCVDGPAAEEIRRITRPGASITFVGSWPAVCDRAFLSRGVLSERINAAHADRLSVAVADRMTSRRTAAALVVAADADRHGNLPDGIVAGAAAGAHRAPLLYTDGRQLSPAVRSWLRSERGVETIYLMGGTTTLAPEIERELRALGRQVVRIAGEDRVATALALASRPELFPDGGPVVIASARGWADAVAGSALAARRGAPVLLTGPTPDARVDRWLARRAPRGGFVLGGTDGVTQPVQTSYTRHVRAAR